ncbi:MAG: acyltransferase [Phenylobacterium sp.]|uniref:acyltransferase family protein n=1 Tax=Phenylobacterium sp. TaxID=1871053 RepID=UPI002727B7C6|nr:acyltransferase [Phenylobacterium sp.]MDO9430669.1 acyltransferase [Phenylobacterium sp.]
MAAAASHAYRPHLPGVESLRAYAAFAIVIFHVIHLTQAPVPHSLEFMKWFFGYGVPLFFVVSAFSLAYGYEGKLSTKAQTTEFYLRRVLRIAPLYYLAVAVQLMSIKAQGYDMPSLGDIALSLGFVFNLSPHMVDGIAPASWSIGVEMLFYAAFPLLLAIATTLPRAIFLTAIFAAGAVAYTIIGSKLKVNPSFVVHGLAFNLPYFGFGLIAFQLFRLTPARLGWYLTFGALALTVAAWAAAPIFNRPGGGMYRSVLYMAAWGAPFGLLCLGMALRPPGLLSNPVTQFLGKISFGVYLAHPQVIFGLSRLGVYEAIQRLPGGSGLTFPLAVLVTCAAVIPLAWGLFVFVETPGIQMGRRIARRLVPSPPTAVEPPVAA